MPAPGRGVRDGGRHDAPWHLHPPRVRGRPSVTRRRRPRRSRAWKPGPQRQVTVVTVPLVSANGVGSQKSLVVGLSNWASPRIFVYHPKANGIEPLPGIGDVQCEGSSPGPQHRRPLIDVGKGTRAVDPAPRLQVVGAQGAQWVRGRGFAAPHVTLVGDRTVRERPRTERTRGRERPTTAVISFRRGNGEVDVVCLPRVRNHCPPTREQARPRRVEARHAQTQLGPQASRRPPMVREWRAEAPLHGLQEAPACPCRCLRAPVRLEGTHLPGVAKGSRGRPPTHVAPGNR